MTNLIHLEHLYELPCHVYWKDKKGIYRGSNDYIAIASKTQRYAGKDIIGLTDKDICLKDIAAVFQSNDKAVLRQKTPLNMIEEVKFICGLSYRVSTFKQPLFNSEDKPIGVLGLSFMLNQPHSNAAMLQEKNPLNLQLLGNLKNNYDTQQTGHFAKLTARQLDCLYHLTLGKTAKQIAETLNLSKRTIEYYINVLKIKLCCYSRYDLISKGFEMSVIKDKLNNKLKF